MFTDKVTATVIEIKGICHYGHKLGDRLELSCYDSGGFCGYCYHNLFHNLQTFVNGGSLPWWPEGGFFAECPDTENRVVLKLERI
jgi:uncharacterized repeat protein (TIGR04076 family)